MAGHERIMFRIVIIQTIISVAGLVVLTPLYGLIGASIAILLSVTFTNFAAMYFTSKRLSLHWWDRKYLGWLIPTAGSVTFCFLIANTVGNTNKFELLVYLVCNYLVFHLLHLIQGINDDDKEVLQEVLIKFKKEQPI
jgi:O-antigen/teichoic acid export membrane protein